jgi:hypothetical protein
MRTLFATVLLFGASASALHADFSYESKTTLKNGVVGEAVLYAETLVRGGKPVVATHMIKNNRMATLTKKHTTIIDLNRDAIVEIDFARKTYLSMTFDQMKQILANAKTRSGGSGTFDVSSKAAGGSKAFGFFNARHTIVTMALPASSDSHPESVSRVLVDSWLLTMPGFSEAEDFRRKLGEKLSYAFASGLSEIGLLEPKFLAGLEEIGKLTNEGDDMPVERTIRMGAPDSGDLEPHDEASSQKNGVVSETLSRIGNLGRKKNAGEPAPPPTGLLLDLTTELSNFGSGPADEVKFNVPEGFKQVQPPASKTSH